jgi:exosortase/archaeosortase family protein
LTSRFDIIGLIIQTLVNDSTGRILLSFNQKNNKSQKPFQPTKRYSTRQIMELTEKRRKQLDEEEARLKKPDAAQPQTALPDPEASSASSQEPVIQHPVLELKTKAQPETVENQNQPLIKTIEHPDPVLPVSLTQTPKESVIPDGQTVAGIFREAPRNDTEKEITEIISREFDKAAQNLDAGKMPSQELSAGEAVVEKAASFVTETPDSTLEFAPVDNRPNNVRAKRELKKQSNTALDVVRFILEAVFYGVSFVLMALMMVHLLQVGWNKYYYDQSPFILMMGLTMVWINRRNFVKRTHWFWGSTVIIAGGIGVFIASAMEGHAYIELASFLIVCFGLFLWRYREECTCRLFFPLVSLLFVYAPPGSWEKVTIMTFYSGDPTAFRSIVVAAVLAIVCLTFQNMATSWSAVLLASVVFWALLGNILRVTVTGLMLENFGLEYASTFYSDYSVFVVMFIILAGLALTSGLLPHQEDFE